jgi:penicillin-binding protein 1A
MSDADITPLPTSRRARRRAKKVRKPRVRKLRLLLVLIPLAFIAAVSTLFGMMMAVAGDLPTISAASQLRHAHNSVLYDDTGKLIGILTTSKSRILLQYTQISPWAVDAVTAIEDKRFFTNSGVDLRGIARAFVSDVVAGRPAQGGSTITQQLVKNALAAEDNRTVFEKLREAALAWHLTRRWTKQQILTDYLNTIYYGNGAYGIEAAARTYFGSDERYHNCGATLSNPCAKLLTPADSALLAAVIASPSGYDPVAHPIAAKQRRNLVLKNMFAQHLLPYSQYRDALSQPLWSGKLDPPQRSEKAPYFADWIRSLLDQRFGSSVVESGLRVDTTLDLQLQTLAEQTVSRYMSNPNGPTASLVAIDNATGEVRAMVGGPGYDVSSYNLATQGRRQPGSAFKAFVLAQALREGISPDSTWPSKRRKWVVPNSGGKEIFSPDNFEGTYVGQRTLTNALAFSDNSVFAAVGIQSGVKRIAKLARRIGIRTPVSHNYAMTLGGLTVGVTPLDMAHAYETFAHDGQRVDGTLLGAKYKGPVGITKVTRLGNGQVVARNRTHLIRVLSPEVDREEVGMLRQVVLIGTAKNADFGGFAAGKTGTTEHYGDAWFVGFTDKLTVAVWVGYPNSGKSMVTDYNGSPVEGGTFPSLIWRDFAGPATAILQQRTTERRAKINAQRAEKGLAPLSDTTDTTGLPPGASEPAVPEAGGTTPSTTPDTAGTTPQTPDAAKTPKTPAVQNPPPNATPTPNPAPTPAPSGAGGSNSGGVEAP